TEYHSEAFLNSSFIGVLIVTFCAGLSSWMLYQPFEDRRNYEAKLSPWILTYGLLWLFGGYEYQIESHRELRTYHGNLILFLTLLCNTALIWLSKRFSWTTASKAVLWMMLPLLVVVLGMMSSSGHPSEHHGAILWTLAIAMYFLNLKNTESIGQTFKLNLHLFTTVLVYFLLLWEGVWQVLLGASLLSVLFYYLYKRYEWLQMRACALSLLPLMLFLSFSCLLSRDIHPFYLPDNTMGISWTFENGYILWPLAFGVLYRLFYQCDSDESEVKTLPMFHALALLLIVTLITWEASWHLTRHLTSLNGWHLALFPLAAIAALWFIMQAQIWPFKQHYDAYFRIASPLLIIYLFIWSLSNLSSPADSTPLPWIPFINPAELMQAIVFITLIRFVFVTPENHLSEKAKRNAYIVIAHFIFLWLNYVLLRTIHHWGDFPWSGRLWSAAVTQTCLSIFWTLTGLSFAVIATRKKVRKLWIVGATLLVVVIIKLLLFDMSSSNSIERIVSFITVGVLLMLIGYFAPLPPAEKEK
ncbi:MAG: DUF2339 domain-containing protein, partial [Methylococcaceae bacterium]|nr:DUF2339 domain-containing protein [Methylococcaceae bacterium]